MTAFDPQLHAAQPSLSASVRANAGSGKTWTLIARVARLLLNGAQPQTILCVTYTKAAAAEMQRRLFEILGQWAVMPDKPLAKELANYGAEAGDLSVARRLFARALETPGGLKIQTIHAFCEQLLRRFPLEAGVAPGFQVLDDAIAADLARQARLDLALIAQADAAGPIGQAYDRMSVRCDLRTFEAMLQVLVRRRAQLEALAAEGGLEDRLWTLCGLPGPTPDEDIIAPALAAISGDVLRIARDLLAASGGKTDGESAVAIAGMLERHGRGELSFEAAIAVFATGKGEPRRHFDTSTALRARADIHAALIDIRDQLFAASAALKAAAMARDSTSVLILGLTYGQLYDQAKRRLSGLDFDDLIERVRALLTTREGAAWALYKLDGGIDHILLDEAQDTAADQWDILRALADEFFAGQGVERQGLPPGGRTVFFVGDEKQSIYGFNGAAPERLAGETEAYRDLVKGAGRPFDIIALNKSRRSAPQLLAFIDAVSNLPQVHAGLIPGGDASRAIVHEHHRERAGCVELWPLEEADPSPEIDPWLPVDVEPADSANKKLARRIASDIDRAIRAGDAAPGDFMILVRRRKALFEEIIRALKFKRVPVAGADRLRLSAHIGFQDLLALARFCLAPHDDLTLAAILRSPFCAVDENSLYDLAQPRGDLRLWTTLTAQADERPDWREAADFLNWVRACADRLGPFDLYGRVLNRLDAQGRSMRSRMLTRLGPEAADVIDAFLSEALKAEQTGARALESFVAALGMTELEIKREQDEASGVVRVMTVHGAKGLEAPIVYLPDTTTAARPANDPLLAVEDLWLWAPRADDDCPSSAQARLRRKALGADESSRLLYVAMTRARDRLVICGVNLSNRKTGQDEGSWYDLMSQGFEKLDSQTVELEGLTIRRHGAPPDRAPVKDMASQAAAEPAWLSRQPPAEGVGPRYLSPSALADNEAADEAASPLSRRDGLGRFRRGTLIHRLLQLLPDIQPETRRNAAKRVLAREPDLTDAQRAEMIEAAFGVLDDPRFAAVFGPGSRAEVAVAGQAAALPPGLAIGGRLDRLIVQPDRVLVADFKTNRPSPARIEDADPAYITQMAAYTAVLAEAFPGRRIEAALVWTDGPKLMAVPENMLSAALARLAVTP